VHRIKLLHHLPYCHALAAGRFIGHSERSLLHLPTSCTEPLTALSHPYIPSQADEAKAQFAHVDGDHLSLLNVYHAYKQVGTGPCVLSLITPSLHSFFIPSTRQFHHFYAIIDFTFCVCVAGDDSRYRNCGPPHCRTILLQLIHMRLHTPHCTALQHSPLFYYTQFLCTLEERMLCITPQPSTFQPLFFTLRRVRIRNGAGIILLTSGQCRAQRV
jgi:hypothetical protein